MVGFNNVSSRVDKLKEKSVKSEELSPTMSAKC